MEERVRATYLLESGFALERAAQVIAGEQAGGIFALEAAVPLDPGGPLCIGRPDFFGRLKGGRTA